PGHNEIDEPRFTQPVMYQAIHAREPVHQMYASALRARGLDVGGADTAAKQLAAELRAAFDAAKSYQVNHADWFEGRWSGLRPGTEADMLAGTPTGLPRDRLLE